MNIEEKKMVIKGLNDILSEINDWFDGQYDSTADFADCIADIAQTMLVKLETAKNEKAQGIDAAYEQALADGQITFNQTKIQA